MQTRIVRVYLILELPDESLTFEELAEMLNNDKAILQDAHIEQIETAPAENWSNPNG